MSEWWDRLSGQWSWDDPMILLGLITVAVTALIPVLLWRLGAKQGERDSDLRALQTKTLNRQEQILKRQRRDSLINIVELSSEATHLGLLWDEVRGYEGEDRKLLQSVFRANVALALPGSHAGVKVNDDLDDQSVSDYIAGLERRSSKNERGLYPYDSLVQFLARAKMDNIKFDVSRLVSLVTGPTSEVQRPGHTFYRELVNILPESAGGLLLKVEDIDSRTSGGTRLNVLTGTLLGIIDIELGRTTANSAPRESALAELRSSVPTSLATLLHRDNPRSLDRWSLEGSTEPVSATVAWLIRAVGWLADTDDHLAMRMVQNLAPAIKSIPAKDRQWGIDDRDVLQGFEWIRNKQPRLWDEYGPELEAAATSIGSWS